MPDLSTLGLLGLFLAALLAGSVLPFPSEGVLVALIAAGESAPLAVAVASLGNVLGAVTIWLIGRGIAYGGGAWLGQRIRRRFTDESSLERARDRVRRWGALALLFSWVPFLGDTLVLGASLVGVRFWLFLTLVSLGKAGRYAAVAWTTLVTLG